MPLREEVQQVEDQPPVREGDHLQDLQATYTTIIIMKIIVDTISQL